MNTAKSKPEPTSSERLQEVVGYLNFSSGSSDAKFLANVNELFAAIERRPSDDPLADESRNVVAELCQQIRSTIDELAANKSAFSDVGQARAVVDLLEQRLLPDYRQFHRDLLWHQDDTRLWRPLFLGRCWEALLAQGGPWEEADRIVDGAIQQLNDYLGYRPVAVLASDQEMEPYPHERVRPIPLYIDGVGIAHGSYEELIDLTLKILRDIDTDLLRDAWFAPDLIEELALDPRAYDFDHPVNKRPNYQFGQWDPYAIDNRGYYRRFVLQQIALDSLLARIEQQQANGDVDGIRRAELLFEAAAVLAGTMLMASGTSGNGPGCHSSEVSLATLLPHIADYRDRFYEQLLQTVDGEHAERLGVEAKRSRQPFGGARQHLNHELARRRAKQQQHMHLAQLFARMGYPDAALRQARTVRVASARIMAQIYCRLTAGHQAIDSGQLERVAQYLPEIENLLQRGIHCGALVDPWNIVGFGGNFSLFPALENSVRDFRVDDLIELVEQTLDLCSRAWTEAAAVDDAEHEQFFSAGLDRLARWWDQYATASVSGIKRLVGKDIDISTNLVAGALNAWHKAGAAAGDIAFWQMFVDQFDSPKAFQLVVEALLEQGDLVASMALMMQWVSQVDRTPLEDGDASFHPLAQRWLRSVEARQLETGEDLWPLVVKFFAHLEASAEHYWHVPAFELGTESSDPEDSEDEVLEAGLVDQEDELDNLFSAAYEDVVYRDSTNDGFEGDVADEGSDDETDYEQEAEAERLRHRLAFLTTIARLWKHAAIAWDADANGNSDRREPLESWHQQAAARYAQLVHLLEAVHRYRIALPSGSHESMVAFDRRRMIKEAVLEQIITTCVEMSDAGRLLRASAGSPTSLATGGSPTPIRRTVELLRAVLAGDADAVRRHWQPFTRSLAQQELLYLPLAKGGNPRRIVKARALGQLIHDLLGWLPRLGLVRETCQLLEVAKTMEAQHQVGQGAVTEYDRLFTCGYQAIVKCLVASADLWDDTCSSAAGATGEPATDECIRSSDAMLVEALQDLTESQLRRWLEHSRTLRLSVVEKLVDPNDWKAFVLFIERYGGDLFSQRFLNLGNLRAILAQRTAVWLSNLEQDPDAQEIRLVREMGDAIPRQQAAKLLTLALEAVVENFREYRDYNSTTTQSDHGEMLYTFVDFLRLKAAYDRVAWNLKPVVMAHEILVRQNRPAAADLWQRALAERTADAADTHQARFAELCETYGMRLPTVAERLAERFTRPLAIDRVRALVEPAIVAADETGEEFASLEREIESLAGEPAGAGLDIPDWLAALEDEVTTVRTARRHREITADLLRRIGQVPLEWDELQKQLGDE